MKAGKVWGETEQIIANGSVEMHRVSINKGAMCSQHMHQSKWNGFYVITGALIVRVWKNDYDLTDETIIRAGEFCQVRPGEYHQFEALADTDAIELYWTALDTGDIVRRSVGQSTPEKA